jgi:hypothetical protein
MGTGWNWVRTGTSSGLCYLVTLNLGLHSINREFKLMSSADTPHTTVEISVSLRKPVQEQETHRATAVNSWGGGSPVRICDTSHRPGSMLFLVDSIILLARGDPKRSRYQGRSLHVADFSNR